MVIKNSLFLNPYLVFLFFHFSLRLQYIIQKLPLRHSKDIAHLANKYKSGEILGCRWIYMPRIQLFPYYDINILFL